MPVSTHVAVFAFPFGSHAAPLLNLVKKLASSAPEGVRFSFFNTRESNRSIFSGGSEFPNVNAYDVWDGVPEGHVVSGFGQPIGMFIDATPGNFEAAVKAAEEDVGAKVTCLLTDAFLWFAADMAEKIGVPWVAFWTAGSCALSAHLYTDDLRRRYALSDKAEVTNIPGLEGLKISSMPREVLLGNEESPLALMLYKMAQNLHKATAVVINSFEEIDPSITDDLKSKFPKFLNIGPLPSPASSKASNSLSDANNEESCLQWLEKQKPGSVVYISFGSVVTPPPDELVALAEALEASKVPFLWSLRDHARKNLPEEFVGQASEYGKILSWAPQVEVLQSGKIGVFVTHCGWNSILESISCGVPLICRPFFGDQGLNSVMVEEKWRIGLRIRDGVFTKSGTMEAIDVILSSEKGKEIKENVEVLQCRVIDAVKADGSSTKNFQELVEILTKS